MPDFLRESQGGSIKIKAVNGIPEVLGPLPDIRKRRITREEVESIMCKVYNGLWGTCHMVCTDYDLTKGKHPCLHLSCCDRRSSASSASGSGLPIRLQEP